MAIEYLPVTWDQYHRHALTMADHLLTDQKKSEEIVAIARGGLTLGHLMADLLRIPISTITIQSYVDVQTQGELTITQELQKPIKGKRVLLVDDVSDSGKTLERAISYLRSFEPTDITTLTMFLKPHSVKKPDYYAEETSKWILFPYEPSEMIGLIQKSLEKEGQNVEEITQFLHDLGYTDEYIQFVRSHYI